MELFSEETVHAFKKMVGTTAFSLRLLITDSSAFSDLEVLHEVEKGVKHMYQAHCVDIQPTNLQIS